MSGGSWKYHEPDGERMCIITFSLSKLGQVDPLSLSCGQNKVLSAMTRSSIFLRFRESYDKLELKK
jgi:hypothetical protein